MKDEYFDEIIKRKTWKIHIKKSVTPHFEGVRSGDKIFEIRLNDCDYCAGDLLLQRHYDPVKEVYLGPIEYHQIKHVIDFEQKEGFVVFSLFPPTPIQEEVVQKTLKELYLA